MNPKFFANREFPVVVSKTYFTAIAASVCALMLAATGAGAANAACLSKAGDINGNGQTNVADAQCLFLGILWELGGKVGSAPTCVAGGIQNADLDCNNSLNVTDANIVVQLIFGLALDAGLDANANGCVDVCEVGSAVCGNGLTEPGEECDDGVGNSDVLADFCRTSCELPACGDGVVDSGEQCDDGNGVDGDGCETACTFTGGGYPLPYVEPFTAGSFAAVSWTIESDGGSSANNWGLTGSGPLGPDNHPRFLYLPTVSNFTDRIVSPYINCSSAVFVTMRFDQAFALPSAVSGTVLSVHVSSDGGDTWQTAWSHNSSAGNIAPTTTQLDLTSYLAGSAEARIAFRIVGPTSSQITYWEIDNVEVRSGAAPVLNSIANVSVAADDTGDFEVSALDLDTDAGDLVFSLGNAPSFVSITNNGDGTATVSYAPDAGDVGTYSNIAVHVTDGQFISTKTFTAVVTGGVAGTPAYVTIRTQAGGAGTEVNNVTMVSGGTLALFAASYDALGTYTGDVPAVWSVLGTLNALPATASSAIVFSPTTGGTSGQIKATPTNGSILSDTTGTITVNVPPPGALDLTLSTVSAAPSVLSANGTDKSLITVKAVDTNGSPLTGATVVISATAGTLLGSVVESPGGLYTRELQATSSPTTAIVTATVGGTLLTSQATVQFQTYIDLKAAGVTTLNCANYPTYQGANLLIQATTVAISSAGCAPMVFGDVIIGTTGTLTQPDVLAGQDHFIDLQVESFTIQPGGKIDVSKKGYRGANGSADATGYWYGNTKVGGSDLSIGGAHGGIGGRAPNGVQTTVYDYYYDPRYPGAGGGKYNNTSTYRGGNGGGVVRIKASEPFVNHGLILADGEDRNPGADERGAGGAGGSIKLEAPYFAGTGTISARGGNGHTSYSGGGGGGRIAIVGFDTLAGNFAYGVVVSKVTAQGGLGVSNYNGGSGTVFLQSNTQQYGDLVIWNNNQISEVSSTPLIIAPSGVISLVDGENLTDFGAFWTNNWYAGTWVNPNVAQAGGGSGLSTIELFKITGHDVNTMVLSGGVPLATVANDNDAYRGVMILDRLHIAGRANVGVVGDLWVADGDLNTNGGPAMTIGGGLKALQVDLSDIDALTVDGGILDVTELYSGQDNSYEFTTVVNNGGIAKPTIFATSINATNSTVVATNVFASGAATSNNTSWTVTDMEADSLNITGGNSTIGDLILAQNLFGNAPTMTLGTLVAGTDIVFDNAANITMKDALVQAGNLVELKGTANLTHEKMIKGGPIERVHIVTKFLKIGANAKIDVSSRGYLGANGAADAFGFWYGNTTDGGANASHGGTHGGLGGYAAIAHLYGSVFTPTFPGAGGGKYNNSATYRGGDGGGVVRIQASTSVLVDGKILADGELRNQGCCDERGAGGAGGSIWITTKHLGGALTGKITTNGGGGSTSYSGGGGGGRIAVDGLTGRSGAFGGSAVVNGLESKGGVGVSNKNGGAGTIYLKTLTETYGQLIVDNEGQLSDPESTPIPSIPQGTVSSVAGTSLFDFGAGLLPTRYDGSWVNPDVNQAGPNSPLLGQQLFYVTSHSATEFVTSGSVPLSTIASPGETYRGILPLDRLEVRGKANMSVLGDLLVLSGDITGTELNTMKLEGTMKANIIDLNTVSKFDIFNGGIIAEIVYGGGGASDFDFDYIVTNGTVDLPVIQAKNMSLNNSIINSGDVTVDTNFAATGGTVNVANMLVGGTTSFTGVTATTATINSTGTITFNGGTGTIGKLLSGDDINIGTSATVTITNTDVQAVDAVNVSGTATLTHCKTTKTAVCKLTIASNSLTVGSTAFINVSSKGYLGANGAADPAGYTVGNTTVGGAAASVGASHGGVGGYGSNAEVYGTFLAPVEPGAGGGKYNNTATYRGGDGGGVVRINATAFVAIDGKIHADGELRNQGCCDERGAGGAGGSVYITTGQLGGNGKITANGGGGSTSYSGGGAGGRIAVTGFTSLSGIFANPNTVNSLEAKGGIGVSNKNGGAGTIYLRSASQLYGDLIIDNESQLSDNFSTFIRVTPESQSTTISGVTLTNLGAVWQTDMFKGLRVNPNVNQVGASAGVWSQALFSVTANSANTLTLAGSQPLESVANSGDTYRGVLALDNLEIRGDGRLEVNGDVAVQSGDYATNNSTTYASSGLLKANWLDLKNVTTFSFTNGGLDVKKVFSNGTDAYGFAHTHSGGSLTVPAISAATLNLTNVAVTATTVDVTGALTTSGGSMTTGNITVGTNASFTNTSLNSGDLSTGGNLTISGANSSIDRLLSSQNITIGGNAVVTIRKDSVTASDTVTVTDTATLTHCDTLPGGSECKLVITADGMVVGANAAIDVSNRGFTGANGAADAAGYSIGNSVAKGAGASVGGSYGGTGGYAGADRVYGRFDAPMTSGAGGGKYNNSATYRGGDGGGVVRAILASTAVINGEIRSNGELRNQGCCDERGAGGAGGSIWITTPILSGTGKIKALGGGGSTSYSGGGSGGRIAVTGVTTLANNFAPAAFANNVLAYGGVGVSNKNGGAGTIYVRTSTQSYGALIIDNASQISDANTTPVLVAPGGTVTGITATSMTDFSGTWNANDYAGTYLNPNIGQTGAETGLQTIELFAVTANTNDTMTLSGGVGANTIANIGDTYRGVLVLDHLDVRRRARVNVPGDILVLSGNLGAASPATWTVDGDLTANIVDLNLSDAITVTNGIFSTSEVFSNSMPDFAFAYSFNQGGIVEGLIDATTIAGTGATLTGGATDATSINVSSGTFNLGDTSVSGNVTLTGVSGAFGDLSCANYSGSGGNLTVDTLSATGNATVAGSAVLTINDTDVTVGGILTVSDTANLTHCATNASKVCKLDISTSELFVGTGATIDVSTQGFLGGSGANLPYTVGNSTTNSAPNSWGGTYGGQGGYDTVDRYYGQLFAPTEPGAGGGKYNNTATYRGGDGGGVVRIVAVTSAVVNGSIRANGELRNQGCCDERGAGGAGGSIWLTTPVLSGTGLIQANGGGGSTSYSGGGGGGRVAITGVSNFAGNFAPNVIANNVQAFGATGVSNKNGGAGTVYVKSAGQSYGSLIVDNNNMITDPQSTRLPVVAQSVVTAIDAGSLTDFAANWWVDDYVGTFVNPDVTQPGMVTGLTTANLYKVTANTTNKATVSGLPAINTVATVGDTYRGVLIFDTLDIRNKARVKLAGDMLVQSGNFISPTADTLTVGGDFEVNVLDINNTDNVTVANGSVLAAEVFSNQSASQPLGLTLNTSSWQETALHATSLSTTNSTITTGDVEVLGNATISGGTLSTSDWTVGGDIALTGVSGTIGDISALNFTMSNGSLTADTLTTAAAASLTGNAVLTIAQDSVSVGTLLTLSNTAQLTHVPCTTTTISRLLVDADSIVVNSGTKIQANGKGFVPGNNVSAQGYTFGNVTTGGALNYVGGSHGGRGNKGSSGNVVPNSYGSVYEPNLPGGGGGRYNASASERGGYGGGVVRLDAATSVVIHGTVESNGENGSSNGAGGAGGSVVIDTASLTGTGQINAIGGNGGVSYSGGGGGGRIALLNATVMADSFVPATIWNKVKAYGGLGWSSVYGGAGTIFVKQSGAYGDLTIDNNNFNSFANSTELPVVPTGTSTSFPPGNQLQDLTQSWNPDFYLGSYLSPNTNQGGTPRLNDDTFFAILTHNNNTLSLSGNPGAVASPGNTYRGAHVFRNLEIRNKGLLQTNGDIYVVEGDISSNNTTSFVLGSGSTMVVNILDLNTATKSGAGTVTGTVYP
ncbi:MAG: hypothetical protein HUU55_06600 [Myxococcales bacterium]|nr:hypothetical protein [Myxococcales bacterium]